MVVLGARVLVPSASEIALRLGVPNDVIAATMVAFGTSVPELMTPLLRRSERDILKSRWGMSWGRMS